MHQARWASVLLSASVHVYPLASVSWQHCPLVSLALHLTAVYCVQPVIVIQLSVSLLPAMY